MDDEKSSMYGRGGQRFRQSDNQPIEHLLSSLATSLTSISVLMPKAVDNIALDNCRNAVMFVAFFGSFHRVVVKTTNNL